MSELTEQEIDAIVAEGGFRNAAGGIYSTSVYKFARAIQEELDSRTPEPGQPAQGRIGQHWLEVAYERLQGGEPEIGVLKDYGYVREEPRQPEAGQFIPDKATQDQIASVMLQYGTEEQRQKALELCAKWSTDSILGIFEKHGIRIELGATYSVKGQIAQLIEGAREIISVNSPSQPEQGEAEPVADNFPLFHGWPEKVIENVARAFWRRIEPYKGQFEKELSKPLPVHFSSFMTAAMMWAHPGYARPAPRAAVPSKWKEGLWRYGFTNMDFGLMPEGPYVLLAQVESALAAAPEQGGVLEEPAP